MDRGLLMAGLAAFLEAEVIVFSGTLGGIVFAVALCSGLIIGHVRQGDGGRSQRHRFLMRAVPLVGVLAAVVPRVTEAAGLMPDRPQASCATNSGIPGDPGPIISGIFGMVTNDAGLAVTSLGVLAMLFASGKISIMGHRGGLGSFIFGLVACVAGIWAWSGNAMAMVHHFAGCAPA